MTMYEAMNKKVDDLCKAGDACMDSGKRDMAVIWYTHAAKLRDKIGSMSVEEASVIL